MTPRQLAMVDAISRSWAARSRGPSTRDLAAELGISQPRAREVLGRLVRLGAVRIVVVDGRAVARSYCVPDRCHAGAGHGEAWQRGAFGALCDPCWSSVRLALRLP